jgi:hypothetical protein
MIGTDAITAADFLRFAMAQFGVMAVVMAVA